VPAAKIEWTEGWNRQRQDRPSVERFQADLPET